MDYGKTFQNGIRDLAYNRHTWEIFQDYVELFALTIMQRTEYDQGREDRYMEVVGKYEPDKIRKIFPVLNDCVVQALMEEPQDFLGRMFMEMDLGSHWAGQFFTPYCISKMMAEINFMNLELEPWGVITVSEPTVGSGGMVIACAEALCNRKMNYPTQMHVVCQDISITCFHMAYIQLSLMGISAEVVLGDTLKVEVRKCWRTPMSYMTGYTLETITKMRKMKELFASMSEGERKEPEPFDIEIPEIPEALEVPASCGPALAEQVAFKMNMPKQKQLDFSAFLPAASENGEIEQEV